MSSQAALCRKLLVSRRFREDLFGQITQEPDSLSFVVLGKERQIFYTFAKTLASVFCLLPNSTESAIGGYFVSKSGVLDRSADQLWGRILLD